MEHVLRAFLEITTRHTDLKWGKTRDDLISKTMKALRVFRDGKDLEGLKAVRELSFEIEDTLLLLHSFVKEHPEDVERLINLLSMFIKSPAPCKIRLINFTEALLEDRRVSQTGKV